MVIFQEKHRQLVEHMDIQEQYSSLQHSSQVFTGLTWLAAVAETGALTMATAEELA